MGYYAGLSANVDGLIEHDTVSSAPDAPVLNATSAAPVSGYAWRNGRVIPFTLETGAKTPRTVHVLPEQMIMAALLLASFAAPILHLLG